MSRVNEKYYHYCHPGFETEQDRVEELKAWIAREELSDASAWAKCRAKYTISWETFKKVLDGEKEGSMPFWETISKCIGVRMVTKRNIVNNHTPRRNEVKHHEVHKTKELTDLEWISRNIRQFGNCAVSAKILKKNEHLLKDLAAMGLYCYTREDSTGNPILWKYTKEELTFRIE